MDCFTATGAQFDDGQYEDYDAVILATGYRSNVPKWLKVLQSYHEVYYEILLCFNKMEADEVACSLQDDSKFFSEEGLPKQPFPHGWKGECGLYVAGLGRKGLLGASNDARRIAADIAAESSTDMPMRLVPYKQTRLLQLTDQ